MGANLQIPDHTSQHNSIHFQNNMSPTSANYINHSPGFLVTGYTPAQLNQQCTFTNLLNNQGENTGMPIQPRMTTTTTSNTDNRNPVVSNVPFVPNTSSMQDCVATQNESECMKDVLPNINKQTHSVSQNSYTAGERKTTFGETLTLI